MLLDKNIFVKLFDKIFFVKISERLGRNSKFVMKGVILIAGRNEVTGQFSHLVPWKKEPGQAKTILSTSKLLTFLPLLLKRGF